LGAWLRRTRRASGSGQVIADVRKEITTCVPSEDNIAMSNIYIEKRSFPPLSRFLWAALFFLVSLGFTDSMLAKGVCLFLAMLQLYYEAFVVMGRFDGHERRLAVFSYYPFLFWFKVEEKARILAEEKVKKIQLELAEQNRANSDASSTPKKEERI
jgi:hypothetical protein